MVQKKEAAEVEFWNKQKPRIELYLRYNYKDIQSIHYSETSSSPMDVSIKGFVNDDTKLEFLASVAGYESEFNNTIMTSDGLEKLVKNRTTAKSVKDIEEEQKSDK